MNKKQVRKIWVLLYVPHDLLKGWPTLNAPNRFDTRKEAREAQKKHQREWPNEVVVVRRMTPRQYKAASK